MTVAIGVWVRLRLRAVLSSSIIAVEPFVHYDVKRALGHRTRENVFCCGDHFEGHSYRDKRDYELVCLSY